MVDVNIQAVARILGYDELRIKLLPQSMEFDNRECIEGAPYSYEKNRFDDLPTAQAEELIKVIILDSGFNSDASKYMDEWILKALSEYIANGVERSDNYFEHEWNEIESENIELFNRIRSGSISHAQMLEQLKEVHHFEEPDMPFSRSAQDYFISEVMDYVDEAMKTIDNEI